MSKNFVEVKLFQDVYIVDYLQCLFIDNVERSSIKA